MSKLWPEVEAQKILDRALKSGKKVVLFETGYGPSGLPHIGTYAEVVRTRWVRQAFDEIASEHGITSELIAFSDDMDGFRKIPEGLPNREMLITQIGLPLCVVKDPHGEADSFASYNIGKLETFLESTNIDGITLARASDYYRSGKFNDALKQMALKHEEVCNVILPTLGKDRRETYSPFMPIHPVTGQVMMVKIEEIDTENWTITWMDNDVTYVTSILDGNCKAQWKADWALRWYALGVDYEMSGKDLIDSVKLSSKICRVLGGIPPINLTYELLLDQGGKKVSKSLGNGFSFEDWLSIGPIESLSQFLFNNPTRAKKIYREMVPQTVDEFIKNNNDNIDGNDNCIKFVGSHSRKIDITYQLLMNLVSASNATSAEEINTYLVKYNPDIDVNDPFVVNMVECAIKYYENYILPEKSFRSPSPEEKIAMLDLLSKFEEGIDDTEECYQYWTFEIGKKYEFNLRSWFQALYEVLLGQSSGPRFGVFVKLYGIDNVIDLMKEKLND